MSSPALQALVKKVFGDEKTKQQFLSNPDSVLTQFDLTEQERKAVWGVHSRLGIDITDSQALEAHIKPLRAWA